MQSILKNIGIMLLAIFAPAQEMILTCLVLIIVDLITGIVAAKKTGQPISSAGIRRTISKIFIYETAIMMGFLTQKYLLSDGAPVAGMIAGVIGLTELTSILENLNKIQGTDMLKSVINKLGSSNDDKPKA